ncbi:MAG: hypothetical protein EBS29_10845 [Chloroflexia bacterium]|nr:hypothetical protein [Chloroflexia bacterium]
MRFFWFRRTAWGFVPITVIGWLISIACGAFCLQISWFFAIHTHSISDFLYQIYPFLVPTYLLWYHIAERTIAE